VAPDETDGKTPPVVDTHDRRIALLTREQRRHDPDAGSHGGDEDEAVDVVPALLHRGSEAAVAVLIGKPFGQRPAAFSQ
jgi:hypothetical protein